MKVTKVEKDRGVETPFLPNAPGAYLAQYGHIILVPSLEGGFPHPSGAIFLGAITESYSGSQNRIQPLKSAKAIRRIKIVEIKYEELP